MKKFIFILFSVFYVIPVCLAQNINGIFTRDSMNFYEIEYYIQSNPEVLTQASDKEVKFFGRWEWFWSTRIDKTGSFLRTRELMNKNLMTLSQEQNYSTGRNLPVFTWETEGPDSRPTGSSPTIGRGRFMCIWVDPDDTTHIMVGAHNGGLWETFDEGVNWECLTDNYPVNGVFGIAVAHENKDIIYIATGIKVYGSIYMNNGYEGYSCGIYKSTDGGQSWSKIPGTEDPEHYFTGLLMHPDTSDILFAMCDYTVYKTTDGGEHWYDLQVPVHNKSVLYDIMFKPNDPNTIYVSGDTALFRTVDGGNTWTDLLGNLINLPGDIPRISIGTDPNHDDILWVYYSNNKTPYAHSGLGGVEKSTDSGNSFIQKSTSNHSGTYYAQEIACAPNGNIFCGGIRLYRSNNEFSTSAINIMNNNIHVDFQDIVFPSISNGDYIIVANDGGIYKTTDGGNNWSNINGNLVTNEFFSFDIANSRRKIYVGGTQDCGSYKYNNQDQWKFLTGGDGGSGLIDQSDTSIIILQKIINYIDQIMEE